MNAAIQSMLAEYNPKTTNDYRQALREILQSVTLLALWRSKFFEVAAFYGGTALRMLYNLDRFSEDMDFSLRVPDSNFSLKKYGKAIETELSAFGFETEFKYRSKTKESAINTAFIETNLIQSLNAIEVDHAVVNNFHVTQKIKIKIEVDTDPSPGFNTEMNPILLPIPFQVRTYGLPDLFAGKMHAALFRSWKKNVKGRDWFDIVWYIGHYPELNLSHLEERMRKSSDWISPGKLTPERFLQLYNTKIDTLDINRARKDVEAFLTDPRVTEIWSKEFFKRIVKKIKFV